MGHGKNAPSGVSQLGVGFKVPTGTLLGIPLEYPWTGLGDTPIWLGGSFGAYPLFLISLLGYYRRSGVLILLLLGSVLPG